MTALITIGNEILLGKTVNTNLAWLASELAELGMPVDYAVSIRDDRTQILEALAHCWERYDLVITTGGLGPTSDDITRGVVAEYFDKELVFEPELWEHVERLFAVRNMVAPSTNRSQAMLPDGFKYLQNDMGTAPGLYFHEAGKSFIALPGVPLELKHLYTRHLPEILAGDFSLVPLVIRNLHTHGISESRLAEILDALLLPDSVNLAYLPQTGRVDLRLYGNSPQDIQIAEAQVREKLEHWIWAADCSSPAAVLLDLLKAKGVTLSVAESCTGGLLGEMITAVPGSSEAFLGGVISYSNQLKMDLLGVSSETLESFGAVSSETALEMLKGLKKLSKSDLAVSITGIAGPDGGTPEKPLGLVHFGFSWGERIWTKREIFAGNRQSIRHKAAEYALIELIKALKDI